MRSLLKLCLLFVLILIVLPACGKKSTDASGAVGSSVSVGVTLPGSTPIGDLPTYCAVNGGSMTTASGVQVCKIQRYATGSVYQDFNHTTGGWLGYATVEAGDTFSATNGGDPMSGAVGSTVVFSISNGQSGNVQISTSGYLYLGVGPVGGSSSTLKLNNIKITRCFDTNNTAYLCN